MPRLRRRYGICLLLRFVKSKGADASGSAQERILPGDGADHGSLSAADASCQIDELAGTDGQVEVLHDDDLPVGDIGAPELDKRFCIWVHKGRFDAQI